MIMLGRPMTASEYASEWESEARGFHTRSDYRWMAEMLGAAQVVLEVGCGAGEGTAELMRLGKGVVVIEQNDHLLEMAERRWASLGVPFQRVRSDQKIGQPCPGAIHIVKASILDASLPLRLAQSGIDCIACWLIGSEPSTIAQVLGVALDTFAGAEMAQYRWVVHRRCYELGLSLLRPDGAVHFVDRCAIAGWNTKSIRRAEHAEEHAREAGSHYEVSGEHVMLRRIVGQFRRSEIQYLIDREAGDLKYVPVLASIRARRRAVA